MTRLGCLTRRSLPTHALIQGTPSYTPLLLCLTPPPQNSIKAGTSTEYEINLRGQRIEWINGLDTVRSEPPPTLTPLLPLRTNANVRPTRRCLPHYPHAFKRLTPSRTPSAHLHTPTPHPILAPPPTVHQGTVPRPLYQPHRANRQPQVLRSSPAAAP